MWSQLSDWFFKREDARSAAAVRIAFCATYLLMLWDFYPVMPLLFGQRGLFGTMEPLAYSLHGWRYLLFTYDSPQALQLWFWLSVLAACCGMLGFKSRVSLAATFFSMLLFRERGPYMTFGADLVLNCVGVLLLFSDSGRTWSVDNLLSKKRREDRAEIENWPMKAIQIQIALIYIVTGLKKIQTTPWQDGSAVYYALQVGNVLKGPGESWIIHHHAIMASLTYFTLLMELSFPLLVFCRQTRWLALLSGFALHSGIDALMSIRFFSLTMYIGYLAFVTEEDWNSLKSGLRAGRTYYLPWLPRGPIFTVGSPIIPPKAPRSFRL